MHPLSKLLRYASAYRRDFKLAALYSVLNKFFDILPEVLIGAAVDVVVNLRYPASGETSGIGVRLMGIGKPVLTSDGEGLGVPVGLGEEEGLLATMRLLAEGPARVRDYGLVLRERVRRENSLERVAAGYLSVLRGEQQRG